MAQSDFFLKIDGIDGESEDKKFSKHIEIESFSFGQSNSGSSSHGGGAGTGKVSFQDFHFTMKTNNSSPKLFEACATGKHIPKGELNVRKAGGDQQVFYTVKFTDVLISSYQTGGLSGGDPRPNDSISFNFSKIEFEYKAQNAKGELGAAIKAGYDLKKAAKV